MVDFRFSIRRIVAAGLLLMAGVSAQAQTNDDDAELQRMMVRELDRLLLHLPDPLPLDAGMQGHVRTLVKEFRPLLTPAVRRWVAETRAALTQTEPGSSWRPALVRLNHELVSWLVAGPGEAHEATEWRLAQRPAYCRERANLHDEAWALLVERLLFLQPLQGTERETAIEAERQRWQRWLSGSLPVSAAPTGAPQLQAFLAAERQRAGEAVPPHPMTPWLSRMMLGEKAPRPYAGMMEECALLQWWLINEAKRRDVAPSEAMRLFRHGTVPASENLLLMPAEFRRRMREAKPLDYPPLATAYEVTGTTRVAYVLDAAGRLQDVRILRHQLQAPGLPPGQPAIAFEQTMDRAAFARIRAMSFERPAPDRLQGGVLRREVELKWSLQ